MNKVTQCLEWAQKRLEIRGCPLTETQLEILHFALHEFEQSHKHSVMQVLASRMQDCPPDIAEAIAKNFDKLLDASPTVASEGQAEANTCVGIVCKNHKFEIMMNGDYECIYCGKSA